MKKTEYAKGFNNGFQACKDKLNDCLDDYNCEKCIHAEVCEHRAKLGLSFNNIIYINKGNDNLKWKQAEYMIAIVCQYYKQKERSD